MPRDNIHHFNLPWIFSHGFPAKLTRNGIRAGFMHDESSESSHREIGSMGLERELRAGNDVALRINGKPAALSSLMMQTIFSPPA